jgi:hypothetical protein
MPHGYSSQFVTSARRHEAKYLRQMHQPTKARCYDLPAPFSRPHAGPKARARKSVFADFPFLEIIAGPLAQLEPVSLMHTNLKSF